MARPRPKAFKVSRDVEPDCPGRLMGVSGGGGPEPVKVRGRARQDACAAGGKVGDMQVQAKVVTLAKTTPARAWPGEVALVAWGQACRDARRAFRSWFGSRFGARRGCKVGRPRFCSGKDNRGVGPAERLTASVSLPAGGPVAKVGDVALVCSRVLACVASSVRVIRAAGGRYCALFVVQVAHTPLPQGAGVVGVGRGLRRLVVLSTGEVACEPWAPAPEGAGVGQGAEGPGEEGEGVQAAGRVAVQHRMVRDSCLDAHHRLALRIVGDDQAICVVDLAVRSWTCTACGLTGDRDLNAAVSILVQRPWSPPGWRRPETLVEAASGKGLVPAAACREPTKVPHERHGRNPGHSWPRGCSKFRADLSATPRSIKEARQALRSAQLTTGWHPGRRCHSWAPPGP